MKFPYRFFSLCAWFLFPLGASADWTVRGGLLFDFPGDLSGQGTTVAKSVVERGIGYNVALGYDVDLLRLELEGVFLKNNLGAIEGTLGSAAGDFKRTTLFANGFLDFPLLPIIGGYLGAGVGVAKASLDFAARDDLGLLESTRFSDGATVFGAQLMVGLRVELGDRLHASLGYRYYLYQDTALRDGAIGLSADSAEQAFDCSLGLRF